MQQLMIYLPPPRDWQIFQNLIGDIARIKYEENSVQEYGRLGQSQNGVDIYAVDSFENRIGLQCKETKNSEIKEKDIRDECDKAIHFIPQLNYFIICTTLKTDAKIQEFINQINAAKKYKFKVQIQFWESINLEINKSSKLLFSLYDDFAQKFEQTDAVRHLNALSAAFNRPAFCDDFLHERNYNDFEDALASTKQLLRTGVLLDRISREVLIQVVPVDKIGDIEYRKFASRVEKSLESIYQKYIKNRNDILSNYQKAANFGGIFNEDRKKLIELINDKLTKNNMQPIKVHH